MLVDFTFPTVQQSMKCALSASSVLGNKLVDTFATHGLNQMVQEPTDFPSGNVFDLILCFHEDRVGISGVCLCLLVAFLV